MPQTSLRVARCHAVMLERLAARTWRVGVPHSGKRCKCLLRCDKRDEDGNAASCEATTAREFILRDLIVFVAAQPLLGLAFHELRARVGLHTAAWSAALFTALQHTVNSSCGTPRKAAGQCTATARRAAVVKVVDGA
jgi:hypothetical protein